MLNNVVIKLLMANFALNYLFTLLFLSKDPLSYAILVRKLSSATAFTIFLEFSNRTPFQANSALFFLSFLLRRLLFILNLIFRFNHFNLIFNCSLRYVRGTDSVKW